MSKPAVNIATVLGLVISLISVCDMLGRFESMVLIVVYVAWGAACVAAMMLTLLFSKPRARFSELARSGSPLLWLRMLVAVALFLLGWYVNGAMEALYGAESPMVADNGVRMFAVIATAVLHVYYLAFTRRKPDL